MVFRQERQRRRRNRSSRIIYIFLTSCLLHCLYIPFWKTTSAFLVNKNNNNNNNRCSNRHHLCRRIRAQGRLSQNIVTELTRTSFKRLNCLKDAAAAVEVTTSKTPNNNKYSDVQQERLQICKHFLETSGILQSLHHYNNEDCNPQTLDKTNLENILEVQPLGDGFANWVFQIHVEHGYMRRKVEEEQRTKKIQSFVIKIYSPMAKTRISYPTRGSIDLLASHLQVGPHVLYRDEDGIIMEYIDGVVLREEDVSGRGRFGNGCNLCECIATKVAQLHYSKKGENGTEVRKNMLWHSLDQMMHYITTFDNDKSSSPNEIEKDVVSQAGWTYERISKEVECMRSVLEKDLNLPLVLAHGDLKPSNIIVSPPPPTMNSNNGDSNVKQQHAELQVVLIDFELSGYNYRGYDIYKLFRTSSSSAASNTKTRKNGYSYPKNMEAFIHAYVKEMEKQQHDDLCKDENKKMKSSTSRDLIDSIICETLLFEPLTWLEAGVFYLFATKGDPYQKERWAKLALDRFQNYKNSMSKFQHCVDEMKKVKKESSSSCFDNSII